MLFEQTVLEGRVGDIFLQSTGFATQIFDFVGGGGAGGISGRAPLARLDELLRPGVIQALGDALLAAQFGDRPEPRFILPSSACFNTNAICASLNFDLFIARSVA